MQKSLLVKLPYRVCTHYSKVIIQSTAVARVSCIIIRCYFVGFGENNQEERSVLCKHGAMANSGQLTLDITCLLDFFHRIIKKHSETGTMHNVKCWASQRRLVSISTRG